MYNPDSLQKLRRKFRRQKLKDRGSLEEALSVQWQAVQIARVEMLLRQEIGDSGGALSGTHAVSQANAAYANLQKLVDQQAQIDALKAEMDELRRQLPMRKVA